MVNDPDSQEEIRLFCGAGCHHKRVCSSTRDVSLRVGTQREWAPVLFRGVPTSCYICTVLALLTAQSRNSSAKKRVRPTGPSRRRGCHSIGLPSLPRLVWSRRCVFFLLPLGVNRHLLPGISSPIHYIFLFS